MTFETRYVISVTDLESVTFECKNCKTQIVWPIDPGHMLFHACAGCGQTLCPDPSDVRKALIQLFQAIREAKRVLKHPECLMTLKINLMPTTQPATGQ